ncbi:unnamed protein product [Caenorhabditis auriculariae]|uniref:Uncharacterized protein n=1 Tax=Caenorhabditis auriculariae TaxID=2777116 RepID=A0A8S1HFU5_9PELO|nr:unnamed protein product [Caenorhabditis auriculariae]
MSAASWLIAFLFFGVNAQFKIPLPFGNIGLLKNDKGEVEITGNKNFNLFGWGTQGDFKVTTGNGTFNIEGSDAALVNGSQYGGASRLGVDEKKGIDIGQNVTLDDKTAAGGSGKESNFLQDLLGIFRNFGKPPS